MKDIVFSCAGLSKSFGSVQALENLDMSLERGEVRALLGKNGAGKSTLVNLISGAYRPDSGKMQINGKDVEWTGPRDAQTGGVAVVHQEFSLIPGLKVAENITLGRWPKKRGLIDRRKEREIAQRALARLGVEVPLEVSAGSLPLAEQQIVEIAKSLVEDPQVLILDEPTSALNSREVEALIGLVRRLADTGMTVVYVSHRMNEIPLVADHLTILRNGREIITGPAESMSFKNVAEHISGEQEGKSDVVKRDMRNRAVVLEIQNLSVPDRLDNVSLKLHKGEVLGIAGLLGSGRTEILRSIFGIELGASGKVIINGVEHRKRSPRKMLGRGVAYISEDRKGEGIVSQLGAGENVLLAARGRVLPKVWIARAKEKLMVQRAFDAMSIQASSLQQEIGTLSGGNQQKAVIGRALVADTQILLLDEPTRGVDIQAKFQLYQIVRKLAAQGYSSIFVSSELEEIAEVCDRVLVLRNGRIEEEILGSDGTPEKILALAMQQEGNYVPNSP